MRGDEGEEITKEGRRGWKEGRKEGEGEGRKQGELEVRREWR